MKHWGITGENVKDAKRIEKAMKEDKRKVEEAKIETCFHAKVLLMMLDHLDTEVEYGLISEEDRLTIMKGLNEIAKVYASQKREEVIERINERGAKRIAEKLGLEAHCVEVGDEE